MIEGHQKSIEKAIGMKIPKGCKFVSRERNKITFDRGDGLRIFVDPKDHKVINHIRLHCPDKKKIILAVGIYRGMQICSNYAKSYAPELDKDFKKMINKLNLYNCIEENYGMYGKEVSK